MCSRSKRKKKHCKEAENNSFVSSFDLNTLIAMEKRPLPMSLSEPTQTEAHQQDQNGQYVLWQTWGRGFGGAGGERSVGTLSTAASDANSSAINTITNHCANRTELIVLCWQKKKRFSAWQRLQKKAGGNPNEKLGWRGCWHGHVNLHLVLQKQKCIKQWLFQNREWCVGRLTSLARRVKRIHQL